VVFQAPPLKEDTILVSVAVVAKVEVLVFLVPDDREALHAAAHEVLLDRTTSREGTGIQTRAQFLMCLVLSVLQFVSFSNNAHVMRRANLRGFIFFAL
jgi:hypothetical protein